MTRYQIIAAADQIAQAIEQAGIAGLLEGTNERSLQDYLKSFKQYNILAEKFSEGALFLEKALGFDTLRDPDPWIVMSKNGEMAADNPLANITGVLSALQAIANMLSENEKLASPADGRDTLTLVLYEQADRPQSSPRRISDALEGMALLYEACARMQQAPFDDLCVVSCDSGGDKLFIFEGGTEIMSSLKDLVLSIWERIVFYRERSLQERISLLTHSLPVLDRAAEMELHGTLGGRDAEAVRVAVTNGVKRFLSSGSMMDAISGHKTVDARSLVLSAPPASASASPVPAPVPAPAPVSTQLDAQQPPERIIDTEPPPADLPAFTPEPTPVSEDANVDDLTWDGILEDDLKTLRELIDKTKRSEEEHG